LETKICRKCNKELPATKEYYSANCANKDGLRYECKTCMAEYQKAWRIKNKEHVEDYNRLYRKEHPEIILEARARNSEKESERKKKYRAENKETVSQKKKQWQLENPEKRRIARHNRRAKARQLPATLTEQQWQIVKEYFHNECAYCGKNGVLEQDHFIALSKGGEYTNNNIIPACPTCNRSKHDKNFHDWYPKQKFYSKKREKSILEYLGYDKQGEQQLALNL